jgi:CHASE1-domain containing sensor protein
VFTSIKENYKKNAEERWLARKERNISGPVELILGSGGPTEVVSGLVGYLRMYITVDDSQPIRGRGIQQTSILQILVSRDRDNGG